MRTLSTYFTFSKFWLSLGILCLLLIGGSVFSSQVQAAQDCNQIICNKDDADFLSCNHRKQACLQDNISEAQNQATSLSSTIAIINGQIALQESQIAQTQAEIHQLELQVKYLSDQIAGLNVSLDKYSEAFVKRVSEDYKSTRVNQGLLVLAANSLSKFLSDLKYLQLTRQQTTTAMQVAETQKTNFDQEKLLKEQKQAEVQQKEALLESQQASLTKQKQDQQNLLAETKNNEAKYQEELKETLAEAEAIQAIIAGKGDETEVKNVNEGDAIATIITGASPCSTGTHLHFEITHNGANENPAGVLKSADIKWLMDSEDQPFSFTGDWNWPLSSPAMITQGYGMTYNARVRRAYNGAPHTGIDMLSRDGSLVVKAVKNGQLYRGSYGGCNGGGYLKYVKVVQSDAYTSYYLHINY